MSPHALLLPQGTHTVSPSCFWGGRSKPQLVSFGGFAVTALPRALFSEYGCANMGLSLIERAYHHGSRLPPIERFGAICSPRRARAQRVQISPPVFHRRWPAVCSVAAFRTSRTTLLRACFGLEHLVLPAFGASGGVRNFSRSRRFFSPLLPLANFLLCKCSRLFFFSRDECRNVMLLYSYSFFRFRDFCEIAIF